mgnify:CR=1 FL=1
MSLVSHWEHEYDKVKVRIHGLFTRMEMAWMKLISEFVTWSASSISNWISTLNHETRNHAMKNCAVIQIVTACFSSNWMAPLFRTCCKFYKVTYCFWSVIRK